MLGKALRERCADNGDLSLGQPVGGLLTILPGNAVRGEGGVPKDGGGPRRGVLSEPPLTPAPRLPPSVR